MCIGHARGIKRMTLTMSTLETKLSINFEISFNASVLARTISLRPCNKLHKLFLIFSKFDLVGLIMTDE